MGSIQVEYQCMKKRPGRIGSRLRWSSVRSVSFFGALGFYPPSIHGRNWTDAKPDRIRRISRESRDFINQIRKTPGIGYRRPRLRRNAVHQQTQSDRTNNVGLGLFWSYNLECTRGIAATPSSSTAHVSVAPWRLSNAIDDLGPEKICAFYPMLTGKGL